MGVKFALSSSARKALGLKVQGGRLVKDESKLIQEVKKDFKEKAPPKIRETVLSDIRKGISPVKGLGKYLKYSDSYKIKIRNSKKFKSEANPTKNRSPVNLRHTGKLHQHFQVYPTGSTRGSFRLAFDWPHRLADIHNNQGASKKKVVRRLLPTKQGEEFNVKIERKIFNELKESVKYVAKRYS